MEQLCAAFLKRVNLTTYTKRFDNFLRGIFVVFDFPSRVSRILVEFAYY